MKIQMHVKGTQQIIDFEAGTQECYLVVEVFGEITRVQCTEEQLQAALAEYVEGQQGAADEGEREPPTAEEQDAVPSVVPPTFVGAVPSDTAPVARGTPRRLARLRRGEAGDDAGIPQG